MPWVRIDENAMDHPKFLALSDGAWRLWCEGQAYCQKHLTNGQIPLAALRGFRYYSASRVRCLTAEHVPGKGPCWHQEPDRSIHVHDYLAWNDSRELVLKAREDSIERRRRWRTRHASPDTEHPLDETPSDVRGVECSESSAFEGESLRGVKPQTLPERAGEFSRWYEDTHERLFSVGYIGTRHDYEDALRLVAKLSDQDLRDAALVWFGQDDDFATTGTRTIGKFASRATGCLQQARAVVGRGM
jgi:hypothetical protein